MPARVGQVLIGSDLAGIDIFRVIEDDPSALAEAEPLAFRVAHGLGQALVENIGLDTLKQTILLGAPQAAGINGQHNVCRACHSFTLHALDQLVRVALQHVDVNTGLVSERLIKNLVGVVMTRRIDVELIGANASGESGAGHCGGERDGETVTLDHEAPRKRAKDE